MTNTHGETMLHSWAASVLCYVYMRSGLIMATIMVAPDHIALYKLPLPVGDPDSYNKPTCHPWVEKLSPTIPHSNSISIGSVIFAGFTAVTSSQTDKCCYVCSNYRVFASYAMQYAPTPGLY